VATQKHSDSEVHDIKGMIVKPNCRAGNKVENNSILAAEEQQLLAASETSSFNSAVVPIMRRKQ